MSSKDIFNFSQRSKFCAFFQTAGRRGGGGGNFLSYSTSFFLFLNFKQLFFSPFFFSKSA
jgi:hypothetical protein